MAGSSCLVASWNRFDDNSTLAASCILGGKRECNALESVDCYVAALRDRPWHPRVDQSFPLKFLERFL